MNRLVLNLNHTANAEEDSEFRTRTGLEPPEFAANPVLGNIGGSLRTLSENHYDDEVWESRAEEAAPNIASRRLVEAVDVEEQNPVMFEHREFAYP